MDFSLDIKEREPDAIKTPSFPQPTASGFPEHKKRPRVSAFKQKQQQREQADGSSSARNVSDKPQAPTVTPVRPVDTGLAGERRRIAEENANLLASMSPEQIEEEQRELLERLDPSIVQMLLKRANIDPQSSASVFDEPAATTQETSEPGRAEDTSSAVADNPAAAPPATNPDKPRKTVRFDEDAAPPSPPADLFEATSQPSSAPTTSTDTFAPNTTHFPQPAPLPDLDPSDPDFLAALHEKYFPTLPADPSKLAWMAPIPTPHSAADRDSPYYPGQASLPLSALRFDFRGRLLSPSASRAVPVTAGLHHHGEAPEAAGYTVAELGRLARSAVPAQRCVAFQTLGRMLYRLGRGEWGGAEADVARGIWGGVKENRVLDSLLEAAGVEEGRGHRGSRAFAVEALWLFEKGGWKEKFQGR